MTAPLARTVRAAHTGLGLVFLCAPGRTARAVRDRPGRRLRWTVAALGVRHLAEAPLAGRRSRRWALVAAGVDGLHAASMVGLALWRPGMRQAAAVDGAVAAALSIAEVGEALAAAPDR